MKEKSTILPYSIHKRIHVRPLRNLIQGIHVNVNTIQSTVLKEAAIKNTYSYWYISYEPIFSSSHLLVPDCLVCVGLWVYEYEYHSARTFLLQCYGKRTIKQYTRTSHVLVGYENTSTRMSTYLQTLQYVSSWSWLSLTFTFLSLLIPYYFNQYILYFTVRQYDQVPVPLYGQEWYEYSRTVIWWIFPLLLCRAPPVEDCADDGRRRRDGFLLWGHGGVVGRLPRPEAQAARRHSEEAAPSFTPSVRLRS